MAAELFDAYWWLIFPVFGMVLAFWGMSQDDRRSKRAMELLKTYAEQGKDPPTELLKLSLNADAHSLLALAGEDESAQRPSSPAWPFIVFAALSAGFGAGFWMTREEGFAWVLLIVTAVMGVLAVGALGILIFGRKS